MLLVVADTSPLFYLLSIGEINLLPRLFERVLVPDVVHHELCHPRAPEQVRTWAMSKPEWLEIQRVPAGEDDAVLKALGAGERAAIRVALARHADLLLIDERKGTTVALGRGFEVTGTLGILRLATRRGWIDLADCLARLKRTNFRYRQEILDQLLLECQDFERG
jgi:predicted nucleic acid-binding protein